jgi:hypothetical protein
MCCWWSLAVVSSDVSPVGGGGVGVGFKATRRCHFADVVNGGKPCSYRSKCAGRAVVWASASLEGKVLYPTENTMR